MNTLVAIEAYGGTKDSASKAVSDAFSEIKKIESLISRYIKESEIFRLNQFAAKKPQKVSPVVFELLDTAENLYRQTLGAFDISMGKRTEAWKHPERTKPIYEPKSIRGGIQLDSIGNYTAKNLLHYAVEVVAAPFRVRRSMTTQAKACAYQSLRLPLNSSDMQIFLDRKDMSVFFSTPLEIDLGAIGKGFAIDKAVSALRQSGISEAIIDAGGNIFCFGEESFPVGIKNPIDPDKIISTVRFKNKAVSTSADYERRIAAGGGFYSHIINPKTGLPVQNDILSVSIFSSSAAKADAFSTAVFVMGTEQGMDMINRTEDVEGIIFGRHRDRIRAVYSAGIREKSKFNFLLN